MKDFRLANQVWVHSLHLSLGGVSTLISQEGLEFGEQTAFILGSQGVRKAGFD